jgi:uncharacterized repeat protein (TIGR02543 family)
VTSEKALVRSFSRAIIGFMLKIYYRETASEAAVNRARGIKTVSVITILTLVFSLAPLTLGVQDAYGASGSKSKMKTQQEKVVAVAKSNLGKGPGSFGFGGGGWCTKYVNYSMKKAGIANGKNYPKSGLGASGSFAVYYAKKGSYTALYKKSPANVGYKTKVNYNYIPKKGDIVIIARSKKSRINHVGLVDSIVLNKKGKLKSVKVVHGNWSNRVRYTTFKPHGRSGGRGGSEIVGYATPDYTLRVTLDPGGGEVTKASINTQKGKKYGKLPVPTREGYEFAGWYTKEKNGKRIKAKTKESFSEPHTLYAIWEQTETETVAA